MSPNPRWLQRKKLQATAPNERRLEVKKRFNELTLETFKQAGQTLGRKTNKLAEAIAAVHEPAQAENLFRKIGEVFHYRDEFVRKGILPKPEYVHKYVAGAMASYNAYRQRIRGQT